MKIYMHFPDKTSLFFWFLFLFLVSCPLVDFYSCFISKIGMWGGKQTRSSLYLVCLFETHKVEKIKNKWRLQLNNHTQNNWSYFHLLISSFSSILKLSLGTAWLMYGIALFFFFTNTDRTQIFVRYQFSKVEIRHWCTIIWW